MKKFRKWLVVTLCVALFASSTLGVSAATLKSLFDAKYYAEAYADLKAAFGDDEEALYQHYLTYGIKEGRSASAYFDVQKYRKIYGDLDAAFGDNWELYAQHYLTYGLSEGRDGGGEFDAVSYANRYPDLYAAFGYDLDKLAEHYETYGVAENRNAESQVTVEEREAYQAAGSTGSSDNSDSSDINPDEEYDSEGYRYVYTYDNEGNVICVDIYDPSGEYFVKVEIEYAEDGTVLKETETYADGEIYISEYDEYGRFTKWYINGVLRREYIYTADGKIEKFYDLQGIHYSTFVYVGENRVSGTVYDENGNITGKITYDENGNQLKDVRYYSDGSVEHETIYVDGVRAQWKYYREDGTLQHNSYYNAEGKPIQSETYFADGTTLRSVTYYYENGQPKHAITYNFDGSKENESFYDESGNLIE